LLRGFSHRFKTRYLLYFGVFRFQLRVGSVLVHLRLSLVCQVVQRQS
jgi:hypothetical protein